MFNFLKEVTLLNNKPLNIQYDSGITDIEILYNGSKNLPRKVKKKLRNILKKYETQ